MRTLPEGGFALAYADPPHASQRLYRGPSGWERGAEVVFADRWSWDETAEAAFERLKETAGEADALARALSGMRLILGEGPLLAYALFLAEHAIEIRRLLDERGTFFLHLCRRAAHVGRVLLDAIFGPKRFLNAVIWHKTGGGRGRRWFSRKHDVILWYAKGDEWRFFGDAVRVPRKATSGYARSGITARSGKRYTPDPKGAIPDDVWDVPMVNPMAAERVGYPTQKPEALLERIVLAASAPGEWVMDPFCGSGTTLVTAARHGRRFVGIDSAAEAVKKTEERLQSTLKGVYFVVVEFPSTIGGGRVKFRFFSKHACPNCKIAKEVLERFVSEKGLSKLASVESHDLDTVDGLAEGAYYDVMAVPTIIVERDERIVARFDGQIPKEEELERAIS